MQITFFSFVMSLLWFNLYITLINFFRKKDKFIISFSTIPLIFFMFLSALRLILNFEIPGSIIIKSKKVFPVFYSFIRKQSASNHFNINILQVFILIWILVGLILIINDIIKYIKFKKNLDKLNNNASVDDREFFNKILRETKMENKINIVQNKKISSPFIVGILKAVIYIPKIDFSKEELEYILSHEINHFIGKDSLKKILIQSLKYIFWWNPFSHLFANNFNHILELQCDLKTTANFTDDEKIRYLESITKIIKNPTNTIASHDIAPNLVNIKEVDSLKQRFRIVLNYKGKRNLFNLFNIGICFLALCIYISSYFIIIQPYYKPNNNEVYKENKKDNSFIMEKPNGDYDVYINNLFKYSIKLDDLDENFQDLPIYKEKRD